MTYQVRHTLVCTMALLALLLGITTQSTHAAPVRKVRVTITLNTPQGYPFDTKGKSMQLRAIKQPSEHTLVPKQHFVNWPDHWDWSLAWPLPKSRDFINPSGRGHNDRWAVYSTMLEVGAKYNLYFVNPNPMIMGGRFEITERSTHLPRTDLRMVYHPFDTGLPRIAQIIVSQQPSKNQFNLVWKKNDPRNQVTKRLPTALLRFSTRDRGQYKFAEDDLDPNLAEHTHWKNTGHLYWDDHNETDAEIECDTAIRTSRLVAPADADEFLPPAPTQTGRSRPTSVRP